jgi:hypothetical protein
MTNRDTSCGTRRHHRASGISTLNTHVNEPAAVLQDKDYGAAGIKPKSRALLHITTPDVNGYFVLEIGKSSWMDAKQTKRRNGSFAPRGSRPRFSRNEEEGLLLPW